MFAVYVGGAVVVPEPLEENPNQAMAERLAEEGALEARSVTDAISVLAVSVSSCLDLLMPVFLAVRVVQVSCISCKP